MENLIGCKIGGHESLLRMRLFSTFQFSNEKMGLHRPQNEEQLQPGGQVVSSRNCFIAIIIFLVWSNINILWFAFHQKFVQCF